MKQSGLIYTKLSVNETPTGIMVFTTIVDS